MKEKQKTKNGKPGLMPKFMRRRPILVVLFVLMNVAVIAITAVVEFGNSKEADDLSKVVINWWMLIPALLCFLVAVCLDIYKYAMMMRELAPEQQRNKH